MKTEPEFAEPCELRFVASLSPHRDLSTLYRLIVDFTMAASPGLNPLYDVSNLSSPEGMKGAVARLERMASSSVDFVSELRMLLRAPNILALIVSSKNTFSVALFSPLTSVANANQITLTDCAPLSSARSSISCQPIQAHTFLQIRKPMYPLWQRIFSLPLLPISILSLLPSVWMLSYTGGTTLQRLALASRSKPSYKYQRLIERRRVSLGKGRVKLATS